MGRHREIWIWLFFLTFLFVLPLASSAYSDDGPMVSYTTETLLIRGDNISMPEGIHLVGNGTPEDPYYIDSVWINNSGGPGVVINGSSRHIILRGFIVTNSIWARADGFFISNSTNITIVDTMVQGCYIGLHIDNSSDIQVVGSDLSGNRYGILMRRSPGIAVTDCTASGNLIDGFYVERSEKCIISFCQLISNSARISNDAAIRVIRSSHTIIQGCEIRMNYGTGIYLQGPMRFCTILDCDINYNNEGMVLQAISDIRVQGIEFGIDMKAMEMLDVENCSFSDCMVYRNGEGVSMENVTGCTLKRFEFIGSGYGVRLTSSHDNLLVENTFTGSKSFDMMIGSPEDPSLSSDGNRIFGNLFQKDAKNLPSVHDNGNDNLWHHQGQGNTWSGWEWDDKDGDLIADSPFEINGTAGSKDMFPTSDLAPRMIDGTNEVIDTSENGEEGYYWYIFIGVLVIFTLLSVIILLKKDRSNG